jgi:RNA polymerase sigma-70 factor, ECF subfamily
MDENELLQKLRLGDEAAFEFIFRNHFTGLCLFAEHFLKNTKAAEEIVEDFFCDLWDNCAKISITSSLRGYMYRSIHNRCLKYIRHQKVEEQYIAEHQYYFTDREILETVTEDYPMVNLIAKELENKITVIIDSLPAQCKKVFCMNRFDNLTYQEIADKLNVSINTVKTQMARALQKLRIELKDYLILLAVLIVANQAPY